MSFFTANSNTSLSLIHLESFPFGSKSSCFRANIKQRRSNNEKKTILFLFYNDVYKYTRVSVRGCFDEKVFVHSSLSLSFFLSLNSCSLFSSRFCEKCCGSCMLLFFCCVFLFLPFFFFNPMHGKFNGALPFLRSSIRKIRYPLVDALSSCGAPLLPFLFLRFMNLRETYEKNVIIIVLVLDLSLLPKKLMPSIFLR